MEIIKTSKFFKGDKPAEKEIDYWQQFNKTISDLSVKPIDVLIRTSGEIHLSNFLLYQVHIHINVKNIFILKNDPSLLAIHSFAVSKVVFGYNEQDVTQLE